METIKNNEIRCETQPLPSPAELNELLPLEKNAKIKVAENRQRVCNILNGRDRRRVAIIGPCSIDETDAVHVFLDGLLPAVDKVSDRVLTVIRAPVSKPRTIGGWRGLEQDSVETARTQLVKLASVGVPVAIELLEPDQIAMFGDVLSLVWVGARTVTTQNLRLEASRHPDLPVLFKNGLDGSICSAVEAMAAAGMRHENVPFLHHDGRKHLENLTPGNPNTLTILRGGSRNGVAMSNINTEKLLEQEVLSVEHGPLNSGVIIDVSHSNGASETSGRKSAEGQQRAFARTLELCANPLVSRLVRGVMIEAFLHEGTGQGFGMSRTDPTVDIATAKQMLIALAELS